MPVIKENMARLLNAAGEKKKRVNILTCASHRDTEHSPLACCQAIIYSMLAERAGVELPTLCKAKGKNEGKKKQHTMRRARFQSDFSMK